MGLSFTRRHLNRSRESGSWMICGSGWRPPEDHFRSWPASSWKEHLIQGASTTLVFYLVSENTKVEPCISYFECCFFSHRWRIWTTLKLQSPSHPSCTTSASLTASAQRSFRNLFSKSCQKWMELVHYLSQWWSWSPFSAEVLPMHCRCIADAAEGMSGWPWPTLIILHNCIHECSSDGLTILYRTLALSSSCFSSRTSVHKLGWTRSCQLPSASLIFLLRSGLWYTNFSFARPQSQSWLAFSWQVQSSAQRNCYVSVGPVWRKQPRFCMDPTNFLWIGHSRARSLAYWTFLKASGLKMGSLYAIYEWVTVASGPWRKCVHEEVYGRSWRILNRSALSFTTKTPSMVIGTQLGGIALQFCAMFKDFWRHNEALIESWLEPSSQLINFPLMCRPSFSA